jgi:hypothetical protein
MTAAPPPPKKLMTSATAAATACGVGTARTRLTAFTGDILLAAAFEICFVPAATLQAKPSCRNFLFQLSLVTGRTNYQWFRTQLLQGFMLVTASITLIFVNGHNDSKKKSKTA